MSGPSRRALRVTAVLAPLVWVVTAASAAVAVPPLTWEDPPPMSLLTALLLFGGIPLALFALIVLAALAPSIAGGGDRERSPDRWSAPEWFNGPESDDEPAHEGPVALEEGTDPARLAPAPEGLSDRFPDGAVATTTRQGVAVRSDPPDASGGSAQRGAHAAGSPAAGGDQAGGRGQAAGRGQAPSGAHAAGRAEAEPGAQAGAGAAHARAATDQVESLWTRGRDEGAPVNEPPPAGAPSMGGTTPANAPRGTGVAVEARYSEGGASARW